MLRRIVPGALGLIALGAACDRPNPRYGDEIAGADGGRDAGAGADASTADRAPALADGPVAEPAPGLVGHWPLDDGPGQNTVRDLSGLGNTGTLAGLDIRAAWKAGKRGMSLEIPDASGAAVVVPAKGALDTLRGGLTIAAWVYRNANLDRHMSVVSRQLGTGNRELYTLAFHVDTLLAWMYTEPPTPNWSVRSNRTAPTATWIHVALTYDGQRVRLYQDAVEVGSQNYTGLFPSSPNPVLLGSNANSSGIDQPLVGRIDEVRIYDRALSREAIAVLAAP